MTRFAVVAALLAVMLPCSPSFAVTAGEKMETCKFGADDQKLEGAKRAKFMKDCMANRNDPRGGSGPPANTMGTTAAPPPKN